jgi:hypothetical protein
VGGSYPSPEKNPGYVTGWKFVIVKRSNCMSTLFFCSTLSNPVYSAANPFNTETTRVVRYLCNALSSYLPNIISLLRWGFCSVVGQLPKLVSYQYCTIIYHKGVHLYINRRGVFFRAQNFVYFRAGFNIWGEKKDN